MSWNDVVSGNGGSSDKKETKYTKLPVGATQLRCLDDAPKGRYTHWIPQANGGRGLSVNCSGKDCPICEIRKGEKEAAKAAGQSMPSYSYNMRKAFAMNVLNRGTNEVEILEKGKTVFEQLKTLQDEIGPVTNYDVKLVRRGTEFNDVSYSALPMAVAPLSATELALEKFDIDKICEPWTAEQIRQAMNGATIADIFGGETNESVETA